MNEKEERTIAMIDLLTKLDRYHTHARFSFSKEETGIIREAILKHMTSVIRGEPELIREAIKGLIDGYKVRTEEMEAMKIKREARDDTDSKFNHGMAVVLRSVVIDLEELIGEEVEE